MRLMMMSEDTASIQGLLHSVLYFSSFFKYVCVCVLY